MSEDKKSKSAEPTATVVVDEQAQVEKEEAAMSAFQIKDRRERTIFIGNIPLEATHKQIKKLVKDHIGESCQIEKVWFRSIATQQDSKMPERAKIVTAKYATHKDNKNGYVLFAEKESVEKSLGLNQSFFLGKHLRVDAVLKSQEEGKKSQPQKGGEDFTTTIFVGNLPYVASEEEVRACFSKFGTIVNVRLVRDPKTYLGKGIGYVQFQDKKMMNDALEAKQPVKFKSRELRLKRATDPKKREKKSNRKQEALEERRERKRQKQLEDQEDEDLLKAMPRKFEDAYESQDSDDDSDDSDNQRKSKKKMNAQIPKHVVSLSSSSQDKQFNALANKKTGKTAEANGEDRELKLQNVIAFNQRRKHNMLKEMIQKAQKTTGKKEGESGIAKLAETKLQKRVFKERHEKPVEKFRVTKRKHIEAKRKENLKKINKIQIKTKKI